MEKVGTSYVAIQDWMYSTLRIDGKKLSLVELNIYAIIHGFCMNGDTVYYGRAKYVEDLLGIPKPTYYRVVNNLVRGGLVVRQQVSFDSIPRTVLFTAVSRNMTPEEAIAQSTPKPPVTPKDKDVPQLSTGSEVQATTEESGNTETTPVSSVPPQYHCETPSLTMRLPPQSHYETHQYHHETDQSHYETPQYHHETALPADNNEITTENNTYTNACARLDKMPQLVDVALTRSVVSTDIGTDAVAGAKTASNSETSADTDAASRSSAGTNANTPTGTQSCELPAEFMRLWQTTKDSKGSCIFAFTSSFFDYNAWTRLWAERPWSLDEMHRAFQNIVNAVNSGILERRFIPCHPDRLALDLGRYLEPLKPRPAAKASNGFGIDLNDGGKAAIIKKAMARH